MRIRIVTEGASFAIGSSAPTPFSSPDEKSLASGAGSGDCDRNSPFDE
jgi:hypothetical protein